MVVAVGINIRATFVAMCATSVWSDRQGQPQPPPQQSYEHAIGGQSGGSLAWDGAEPRGGLWPGLQTQPGPGRGLQGRQQLGLAKVGLAPLASVRQAALRGAQTIVNVVPGRAAVPSGGI